MAKVFNQKIKILYLMQMMWEETDENHVLNMQEILTKLEEKDIRAERKSIYDDFEVLRQFGMDVRFRKSQPSGYYLKDRTFSTEEIVYLVKLATQNCSDPEQTESLIRKLKKQICTYQADESVKIDLTELPVVKKHETVANSPEVSIEEHLMEEPVEEKEIQILFKEKHMGAVLAYGKLSEEPKEHKSGLYKAKMCTVVDERFYGWMVSQGFGIKIVKPKNEAEAYRAHLKKLFKQYK